MSVRVFHAAGVGEGWGASVAAEGLGLRTRSASERVGTGGSLGGGSLACCSTSARRWRGTVVPADASAQAWASAAGI